MTFPPDFNPYLSRMNATRGEVEKRVNLPWQTRRAAPTDYENRLGDALEQAFAAGAETLEDVVKALNDGGLRDPAGQPWNPDSLQVEMRRHA